MGDAKLYVIPASHPSRSAMLMLDRKGIPYERVDLMPVISKGVLRAQRFPGVTVPALKIDGRRIQGPEKSRELDRIRPEPPLFPGDPERRVKVEEAEGWGDEFQQKPRRFSWWALSATASARRPRGQSWGVGRARGEDGARCLLSARFNRPPTRTCVPTSPRFPRTWIGSTGGSRRASWAAMS